MSATNNTVLLPAPILTLIGNILNLADAISHYLNDVVQGIITIASPICSGGMAQKVEGPRLNWTSA